MRWLFVLISLSLSTVVGCSSIIAFGSKSGKICWSSDSQLKWNDFKGDVPRKRTTEVAFTNVNIKYSVLSKKSIQVENCFLKSESWVKKEFKISSILKHEQYHFNIAEVYARKMRKEMEKITYPSTKNVQAVFDSLIVIYEKEQIEYDKETNHSQIKVEQEKWEAKIDKELEQLKSYSNEIVYLNEG